MSEVRSWKLKVGGLNANVQNDTPNNEKIVGATSSRLHSEEPAQERLSRIQKYKQIMEKLKKALNTAGWDGRWYKRAFTDNGDELGSLQNEECRIDGISQSWATISNAGDNDKKYISMESLENHLVDR